MLTFLRTWLISIVAVSILLSILQSVLPEGSVRTVARTTGGLILLLVLLRPLLGVDLSVLSAVGADTSDSVNEQIAAFAAENAAQLQTLVEEKTAEAIASKAAALGISCAPRVTAEQRDGTWFPARADMDIPKAQQLSDYITEELEIDEAHQFWAEDG